MPIRLHTCGAPGVPGKHPCHQVRKALDEAGIEYDIVKNPTFPRSRRKDLMAMSGQQKLPVIEFEDGKTLREESTDMAARIRAGNLFQS